MKSLKQTLKIVAMLGITVFLMSCAKTTILPKENNKFLMVASSKNEHYAYKAAYKKIQLRNVH